MPPSSGRASGKPLPKKRARINSKGIRLYAPGEDPNESLTEPGINAFSGFRMEKFCSKIIMHLFVYFIQNFDTEVTPVHYSLFKARHWHKMLGFHVSIKGQTITQTSRTSWPPFSFFLVMGAEDGFVPILVATMDDSIATEIRIADLSEYNLGSNARNPQFLFNYWILLETIFRIIRIMNHPPSTHPNETIRNYFDREPYEDAVFFLWASCVWAIALKLRLHPAIFITDYFNDDMSEWFLHHLCLTANKLCVKPTGKGQMQDSPDVEVNA